MATWSGLKLRDLASTASLTVERWKIWYQIYKLRYFKQSTSNLFLIYFGVYKYSFNCEMFFYLARQAFWFLQFAHWTQFRRHTASCLETQQPKKHWLVKNWWIFTSLLCTFAFFVHYRIWRIKLKPVRHILSRVCLNLWNRIWDEDRCRCRLCQSKPKDRNCESNQDGPFQFLKFDNIFLLCAKK